MCSCTGVAKVVKLGPGASTFKEGQRVIAAGWPLYSKGQGSWQQYVAVPEKDLVSLGAALLARANYSWHAAETIALIQMWHRECSSAALLNLLQSCMSPVEHAHFLFKSPHFNGLIHRSSHQD